MADNNLEKYQNQNPVQQFFLNRFWQTIIAHAERDMSSPESICDVGCGEGFGMRKLSTLFQNSKLVGVDSDKDALQFAQEKDNRHTYIFGLLPSLPFPDKAFDMTLCTEVLEHIHDTQSALGELARVTNRTCIISVPHEPFFRTMNLLRGRNILRLGNYPYHVHTWSRRKIVHIVSKFFDISRVSTPFPWTVITAHKKSE